MERNNTKTVLKAIPLPTCQRGIYRVLTPSTRPHGTTMTTQRLVNVRVPKYSTIEMCRCAPLSPILLKKGSPLGSFVQMPGERLVHREGGLLVIMLARAVFLKDGTIVAPINSHDLCVARCRVVRQRAMIPAVTLMPASSHHHGSRPGRSSLPRRVIVVAAAALKRVERSESSLYDVAR